MDKITNPHDKFFKEVFTHQKTAEDFLANYLPADVLGLLDLDSLECSKDSYIDKNLEEYFSDLLFKVFLKDGSRGYIYILIEHKSYQDAMTAFYLLRYLVKIWETTLKKGEEKGFPIIIPLVLYHGIKRWRAAKRFRELLDCPAEMQTYIPDFQYVLWDASRYSDDEIKGKVHLRVALLLMKYIFDENLRDRLPDMLVLLRNLSFKRTGLEYIETILKYIANAAPVDKYETASCSWHYLKRFGGSALSCDFTDRRRKCHFYRLKDFVTVSPALVFPT